VVGPDLATSDQQHLSFLTVGDVQMPMSDGSTPSTFRSSWSATADRSVFGSDGRGLHQFGLRHFVDHSTTVVNNVHQKVVSAHMTGFLNGVPVHSYPDVGLDYISYNHVAFLYVTHGEC
jgi:hypothetical protein